MADNDNNDVALALTAANERVGSKTDLAVDSLLDWDSEVRQVTCSPRHATHFASSFLGFNGTS